MTVYGTITAQNRITKTPAPLQTAGGMAAQEITQCRVSNLTRISLSRSSQREHVVREGLRALSFCRENEGARSLTWASAAPIGKPHTANDERNQRDV